MKNANMWYNEKLDEMNDVIKKLAKEAGFVFWGKESWGPGKGNIDWSSNYNNELTTFAKLVKKKFK